MKKLHSTQMVRRSFSAPLKYLLNYDMMPLDKTVLHYGEGLAFADTRAMAVFNNVEAYDPYSPDTAKTVLPNKTFDYVISFYVLNVLPPTDRAAVLEEIFNHATERVIVAVRSDKIEGISFEDGVQMSNGAFQKSFTVDELRATLESYGTITHIKKKNGFIIAEVAKCK